MSNIAMARAATTSVSMVETADSIRIDIGLVIVDPGRFLLLPPAGNPIQ
jgi:hypothetical protein